MIIDSEWCSASTGTRFSTNLTTYREAKGIDRDKYQTIYKFVACLQQGRSISKKVNLRLPGELIEKADVAGKVFHKSRTEIIKEALQEYLQEVEDQEWFKEAVVELYLDDENGFDILKEYIGRQDAESVRASKALLEQGDGAANAAETTSNVVHFDVRERGEIEIDPRR